MALSILNLMQARSTVQQGNEVPFGLEYVVSFVDAFMNFIDRPGGGLQRAVFSGKSKCHCLKSQSNKFNSLILIFSKRS